MHKDLSQYQFDGVGARDEFNRKPIAEKIIKLLTSDIDLSPMIIDGDWGTGKSEFCHKLINKFRSEHPDAQILYIDAFQADHADNPLMTIIAEIMTLIPDEQKKKGFLKKALPVIRYGTKAFLKAGVSHIMKESADSIADGFEKEIQDAANTAIDATVTALLKDHEEAEKNLKALQALLTELAKDNPIIIFIDELDRCRPDFSVQMLEVIKHTFNVENVKFVLVTNSNQLKAAINHAYGATIDAARYLDKFIKFVIELSSKTINQKYEKYNLVSNEYFDLLVQRSNLLKESKLSANFAPPYFLAHKLITINNLSLREVETFVTHLETALVLEVDFNNSTLGFILLYIIAIYIDCFESELKKNIYQNNIDALKLLKIIGVNNIEEIDQGPAMVLILLASQAQKNAEEAKKYIDTYNKNNQFSKPFSELVFAWPVPNDYFAIIIDTIDTLHLR